MPISADTPTNQAAPAGRTPRQRWMAALAKAETAELEAIWAELARQQAPAYELVRAPEVGLAMVRARATGGGPRFNLGEMTLTRCAVRLLPEGKQVPVLGHGYVAGRDPRKAELAAVFDALLQVEAADLTSADAGHGPLHRKVVVPLEAAQARRKGLAAAAAAATRVEFFTMVRGED